MNTRTCRSSRRALRAFRSVALAFLSVTLIAPLAGCNIIGVFAAKVVPPPTIQPRYTGFAEQSLAIMVWAPDGTLIDFPDVRADVAGSVQRKLEQARDVKTKELANIRFAATPAAVVRFQENHPEYDALPLTDVAPKLAGATRVIYVELEDVQTRSAASVELYRGSASATVKVVEVPPDRSAPAVVVYEESGVAAVFPPNAREEGSPNGNDRVIYHGVVDTLSTEIAKRFVPHQEEQ